MAAHSRSTSAMGGSTGPNNGGATREKTYFEQQRESLIGEIAMVRLFLFPHLVPICYFSGI
jgi:hypothetical protein